MKHLSLSPIRTAIYAALLLLSLAHSADAQGQITGAKRYVKLVTNDDGSYIERCTFNKDTSYTLIFKPSSDCYMGGEQTFKISNAEFRRFRNCFRTMTRKIDDTLQESRTITLTKNIWVTGETAPGMLKLTFLLSFPEENTSCSLSLDSIHTAELDSAMKPPSHSNAKMERVQKKLYSYSAPAWASRLIRTDTLYVFFALNDNKQEFRYAELHAKEARKTMAALLDFAGAGAAQAGRSQLEISKQLVLGTENERGRERLYAYILEGENDEHPASFEITKGEAVESVLAMCDFMKQDKDIIKLRERAKGLAQTMKVSADRP